MPVPAVKTTVWSGKVLVTVKAGYVPVADIPVPLAMLTVWSGAVLVIVNVPLVVIGLPLTLIPVPAVAATEVTVPNGFTDHELSVPLVVRYLPLLPVWLGARALNPSFAVDAPVPPFATGTVPVSVWSAFQSLGRTSDVSASSGIVETLLCLTVIAIIERL